MNYLLDQFASHAELIAWVCIAAINIMDFLDPRRPLRPCVAAFGAWVVKLVRRPNR